MSRYSPFDHKLEFVRKLPGKTKEEQEKKSEQAKLLRMEVLLDNAQCVCSFIASVLKNPQLRPEEFNDVMKRDNLIAHPEVVRAFIEGITARRRVVLKTIKDTEAEVTSGQKKGAAEVIHEWIVNGEGRKAEPLRGRVRLRGAYPLAVLLEYENPADFSHVQSDSLREPGSRTDGFLRDPLEGSFNKLLMQLRIGRESFPVIAINGFADGRNPKLYDSIKEEQSHAEHAAFRNALSAVKKKFVWSNIDGREMIVDDAQKLSAEMLKEWEHDPEAAQQSSSWNKVLQVAYSYAKDEILAALTVNRRNMFSKLNKLAWTNGYNYFDLMGFNKVPALYKALKTQYRDTLNLAVETVSEWVRPFYMIGFNERIELSRWILAQIPIERWNDQLKRTLFISESNELFDLYNQYWLLDQAPSKNKEKIKLFEDLTRDLKEHQHKPFFEIMKEYKKRLSDISQKQILDQ